MVEGWTLTRPKEDTINNQHGFSGGQGNNALFPRDGEFPKPLLTTTELCSPLRSLILKDTHYIVMDKHRAAFAQLKEEFTTEIMLPYFNRNKYTTLQIDVLKKGFGAIIIQDNKPIYFTSRSLTPAEKNYQNLEQECMAVMGHGKVRLLPLQ